MVLYKYNNYTIREPKQTDARMIYNELYKAQIGSKILLQNKYSITKVNNLKNIVRSILMLTKKNDTFIILKNDKYIGHIIFDKERFLNFPVVKKMYLIDKNRHSLALTCMGDFLLNHLYKNSQIVSMSANMPGFGKRTTPLFKNMNEPVVIKDIEKLRKTFKRACKGSEYGRK